MNQKAHENLQRFVSRRIKRGEQPDYDTLAGILLDKDPLRKMTEALVQDITSGSLQSVEELTKIASHFDIPADTIVGNRSALQETFAMRNEIIHEMDMDFSSRNRNRKSRTRDSMVSATNNVFGTASSFLGTVDAKLT